MNPVTQMWNEIVDSLLNAQEILEGAAEQVELSVWHEMDAIGIPTVIQPYLLFVVLLLSLTVSIRMLEGVFRVLAITVIAVFLLSLGRRVLSG